MRRILKLIAVIFTTFAFNFAKAQDVQGIIVNGLIVGEKYSQEQLYTTFGTPDSVETTEDGISVLNYGNSRIYWYGEQSSDSERNIFWGADIKDNRFIISDGITVGINKIYLSTKGTTISYKLLEGSKGSLIYWRPKSVPKSMYDAYTVIVHSNSINIIQYISVHINL